MELSTPEMLLEPRMSFLTQVFVCELFFSLVTENKDMPQHRFSDPRDLLAGFDLL